MEIVPAGVEADEQHGIHKIRGLCGIQGTTSLSIAFSYSFKSKSSQF